MDFADRGPCGGMDQNGCDTETGYKALLVADGVIQGIGALEIVSAFVFPETTAVMASTEPHVGLSPTRIGRNGYGVVAVGAF